MDKSVQITLIIVCGILFLSLMSFTFSGNLGTTTTKDTLSVKGTSSIDVVPNLVSVHFNVQTRGDTSGEASSSNTEIYNSLKSNLLAIGFLEGEIQTESYNVYQDYVWDNGKREDNGYIATHSVKVEFSAQEIERVSEVIQVGVDSNSSVSFINFKLSQDLQSQHKAKAIELAAEDAKIKAEAVAKGLDKRVGNLVSVSVDEFFYYPYVAYDARETTVEGSSGSVSVAEIQEAASIVPSDQDVSASVTAVFKIV